MRNFVVLKYLLIIRHAKSSWALPEQDDFDRPLNDRGRKDAPVMAKRLQAKNVSIDLFIASAANRALTTATYFASAYEVPQKRIQQVKKLYHPAPSVFYEVIREIPADIETAAVFSHNPGITEFVNELTEAKLDNMPTCAVFGVTIETDDWKNFEEAKKSFWFFDYPRF